MPDILDIPVETLFIVFWFALSVALSFLED